MNKKYILSWNKRIEDAWGDADYSTINAALKAAEKGQFIHEVTAVTFKVRLSEPEAVRLDEQ